MTHWGKSKLAQEAQGQLCASASVPGGLGQEVIQLAVGGLMEGNQVYLSFPKSTPEQLDCLGMESPFSREREHIGCTIDLPQDVDGAQRLGLIPEEEMASCDMRRDHRQSCWLMYETVAMLSVQTNTWRPDRCKASSTASHSRHLMCQSSRGPVQNSEAACPLHVVHQSALWHPL